MVLIKPLFDDLERVKLNFLKTCEKLVAAGRLEKEEFKDIEVLLDQMEEYEDQEFRSELGKISKGLSDFLDWE
ncbi:MAG: hypothetical protein GX335_06885 [Firmicutes bacterium]|nr:hypothetical protein [Bacillota bacterium]